MSKYLVGALASLSLGAVSSLVFNKDKFFEVDSYDEYEVPDPATELKYKLTDTLISEVNTTGEIMTLLINKMNSYSRVSVSRFEGGLSDILTKFEPNVYTLGVIENAEVITYLAVLMPEGPVALRAALNRGGTFQISWICPDKHLDLLPDLSKITRDNYADYTDVFDILLDCILPEE